MTGDRRRGGMLMEAVIFDLDGTLADTLGTIANVVNLCLSDSGHPTHRLDEYKLMVGDGIVKLCERVLPDTAQAEVPDFLVRVRNCYQEHRSDGARLYDGMQELLDKLQLMDRPMAVLSNKPHELTLGTLEDLGVLECFQVVIGQSDRFPAKPDPGSARFIAEELGVEPARVLYLGDTSTDMQTARAAGMLPVGAEWGFREAQELLDHGARHLVAHPLEVLPLMARQA